MKGKILAYLYSLKHPYFNIFPMALHLYQADTRPGQQQKPLQLLLEDLPSSLHERALRYQSEAAAYNFVWGRLLLKQGLEELGLPYGLEQLQFSEKGKPFLPGIHFNISHTEGKVVCVFSTEGPIGVDVEFLRPVELTNFVAFFTPREWQDIQVAVNPLHRFFFYWTRKESMIKALGVSLAELHRIEVDPTQAQIKADNVDWSIEELELGESYMGALCRQSVS